MTSLYPFIASNCIIYLVVDLVIDLAVCLDVQYGAYLVRPRRA